MITLTALALLGAASAQELTLGVGPILHGYDHTDEALWLVRYLEEHPIEVAGRRVAPKLVDHPSQADYALFGEITGEMDVKYDDNWAASKRAMTRSTVGLTLVVFSIPPTVTLGVIGLYEDNPTIGYAMAGATGASFLVALALWNKRGVRYRWKHQGSFTLYGADQPVAFTVTDAGRRKRFHLHDDLRPALVEGVYAKLADQAEDRLTTAEAGRGAP